MGHAHLHFSIPEVQVISLEIKMPLPIALMQNDAFLHLRRDEYVYSDTEGLRPAKDAHWVKIQPGIPVKRQRKSRAALYKGRWRLCVTRFYFQYAAVETFLIESVPGLETFVGHSYST